MEIKELIGEDIMKAYNGDYISRDFGYSCANFNIRNNKFGHGNENTRETFKFYTENKNNISCIVAYNNDKKICGRRMFFKGKSMINDNEYEYPIKMGEIVNYLYGYYGSFYFDAEKHITKYVLNKYKGYIFTDFHVYKNGVISRDVPNYWIMEIDKMNYSDYPPIDHLYLSTELKCLSNFKPKDYIIQTLKNDFDKSEIKFNTAYRYNPNKENIKYKYTTWKDHRGLYQENDDDYDDENDFKIGDQFISLYNDERIYTIKRIIKDSEEVEFLTDKGIKFTLPYSIINKNFIKI